MSEVKLSKARANAGRRLATARGHLAAIERMVAEGRDCVDVLNQTYALREAVRQVECVLVQECLSERLASGPRPGEYEEFVDQLAILYGLTRR